MNWRDCSLPLGMTAYSRGNPSLQKRNVTFRREARNLLVRGNWLFRTRLNPISGVFFFRLADFGNKDKQQPGY